MADEKPINDMYELGATGLKRFSGFIYEEFQRELTGWKGIAIYKEMSMNDATVSAVLFAIKMLCRQAEWTVKDASEDPADVEAGEFLRSCMSDMSHTWVDMIVEIFSMLEYGHEVSEIVYKSRNGNDIDPSRRSKYDDGRMGWRKISTRSQDTLWRWRFDDNGGIQGVEQIAPPHYQNTFIPIERMLLFRTTVSKNNPEGMSILRGAYKSWYMKKNIENIEAIGAERDLAGLPMAFVPPEILSSNASNAQKAIRATIENIVKNVRRDEQEGIVFPMAYDSNGKLMYDFKLLSTGGSRQFDTDKIINRYDQRIAMTCLADFILLGHQQSNGISLVTSKTNIFTSAIKAYLQIVADIFNIYAIPRLFALNPDMKISKFPEIQVGKVDSVNLAELGTYIQQLSAAGAPLFPNIDLEKYLMRVAGMPEPMDTEEQNAGMNLKVAPIVNTQAARQKEATNTETGTEPTMPTMEDVNASNASLAPNTIRTNEGEFAK